MHQTFLMDLHPLIVHFPIALLLLYSILEVLTLFLKRKEWDFVKTVLIIVGIIGGGAAFLTGDAAGEGVTDPILDYHELFAKLTLVLYGILAVAYALRALTTSKKLSTTLKKPLYKTTSITQYVLNPWVKIPLALIAALALSITGALGGSMVYGPGTDPFAQLVYDILLG